MRFSAIALIILFCGCATADYQSYVLGHMTISEEERQEVLDMSKDCLDETHTDPALFDRLEKRDFPDVREIKCFFKCLAEGLEVIRQRHHIDANALVSKLTPAQLEIAHKCLSIRMDDMCDQIYAAHKCYMVENDKLNH